MNPSIDARWRGLMLAAGAGALLTALCIPLQVATFIAFPPPTSHSVEAWFGLFNETPVLGLLSLDLLMMVEQVLVVPIVLGTWLLVHRASESTALLGTAAWLMGALLLLGSNTGFEMLALARGYAAAGAADQAPYLGAAQAMLATYWDMGTGFVFGYALSSVGGILVGVAMLRARVLGRAAGWLLVVGSIVGTGIFVPGIGVALALTSVLLLWAWYLLIARRLGLLGRGFRRVEARRVPAAAA